MYIASSQYNVFPLFAQLASIMHAALQQSHQIIVS